MINQASLYVGWVDTPNRPTCVSRKSTGGVLTPTGSPLMQKLSFAVSPVHPTLIRLSDTLPRRHSIHCTIPNVRLQLCHPLKSLIWNARACIISCARKETRKDRRQGMQEWAKTSLLFYQPPHPTFSLLQLSCIYSSSHSDATLLRLEKAKERKYRCNKIAPNHLTIQPNLTQSYRPSVLRSYRPFVLHGKQNKLNVNFSDWFSIT